MNVYAVQFCDSLDLSAVNLDLITSLQE